MKIVNGKVKLGRGDVRIGNFVISKEKSHIKFNDIAGLMSHRIAIESPIGQLIKIALDTRKEDRGMDTFLHNYCVVLHTFSFTVPVMNKDFDSLAETLKICYKAINSNKDMYSIKDDLTLEEDRKIVEEQKAVNDFIEKSKEGE